MGVYDRDYYRRDGPSFLGSITETGRMCKYIILVNIVLFVLQFLTLGPSKASSLEEAVGPITSTLWLKPADVLQGHVWQLLTHAFLHSTDDLLHIIFNLLLLWWFGSALEDVYGAWEFLAFYLTATVVSGLLYLLWSVAAGTTLKPALGASGAVSAVVLLYACHWPKRIVYIFFVIPCPIWLLALLYVASDLLGLMGPPTGIAHASHLGGALLGFIYFQSHVRLLNLLPDIKSWRKRRKQPRLRVYRGEPREEEDEPTPTPVPVPSAPVERETFDEHLEAKLDAVLEKVARVGKENLTEGERQILLKASELYRKRRS